MKVCKYELGHNDTVCSGLKEERFRDVEMAASALSANDFCATNVLKILTRLLSSASVNSSKFHAKLTRTLMPLIQVQRRVNSFEITRDWVGNAPPVLFGLVAGALSDHFGRKPLMAAPLFGGSVQLYFVDFGQGSPNVNYRE